MIFDSSLYERLVLSKDKKAVADLSQKGQVSEKAEDIFKEPYVLEFLGIEEKTTYSKSNLETAIYIFASKCSLYLPSKKEHKNR